MQDHHEIETARMLLSPLTLEQVPALHEIFADPETMRFWHSPPQADLEETRAIVEEFIAGPERAWVLCPRNDESAVGLVYYLGNIGHPGMGYILRRDRWGKGLATEAVRGALDYGFTKLGLDQV